ncbi:MAG: DeoR/GlpR family DNA-binding transcription regulator [Actinomycetota bacterium]
MKADTESPELVADRHEWLLARLTERRRVTTNDAAADLGVSVDTVRRDLRLLHDRGLVRRVHGGAVPVSPLSSSFAGRALDDSPERTHLAAAILDRLRPGQVVGLDAGTTTAEVAAQIPRSLEITIVTNGPAVAIALADHPHASVVLLGGDVDLRWMACTGPSTVEGIGRHHLDLAVVGVCAIDVDAGATTRSRHELHTKRAWIAAAAETLVPVESTKLGAVAPFRIADASDVGLMISESATAPEVIDAWRAAGLDVSIT